MQVEVLLVANQASVQDSLLSVLGAGWEYARVGFFPGTVRGHIAGIFTIEDHERGSTPAVDLEITDSKGHVAGFKASMVIGTDRPSTERAVPCRLPFEVPFTFRVSAPTVVKASLLLEGAELAAITFAVLDPIPNEPPTN